jgi:hypothetical protein
MSGRVSNPPYFVVFAIFVARKCFVAWRTTLSVIFAFSAVEPHV